MATVIDSLVVELSLSAEQFKKAQRDALEAFRKTQEEARKHGKDVEEQSKKSVEAIGAIKTQVLDLFAALGGGAAIIGFISRITTADAATGRLSRAIGVSGNAISRWKGVAVEFGSTAENMAASFQSLSNVFTAWQVGGPEAPGIMQIFRVINTEAERLDKNNAKVIDGTKGVQQALLSTADNLKIIHDLAQDKNLAAYLAGKIPGMDAGFFDLLIRGSDNVSAALDRTRGATEAEVNAAGDLAQAWNKLGVAIEGRGRSSGISSSLALMLNTVAGDVSNDKRQWFGGLKNTSSSDWWDALKQGLGFGAPKSSPPSSGPVSSALAYRSAIASIESQGSGGYAAVGPVTASGDRAYGKYQVMGNNIGEWSQAALGKRLSIQDFMASPAAQDAIFDHRFGQYVKQYGNPQDAASAWFTGKPLSAGADRRDILGTSGASYAQRFSAALPAGSTTTTSVAFNGPITINAGPNASASDIAGKLRDLGMRRQADANQSSVGGQ